MYEQPGIQYGPNEVSGERWPHSPDGMAIPEMCHTHQSSRYSILNVRRLGGAPNVGHSQDDMSMFYSEVFLTDRFAMRIV